MCKPCHVESGKKFRRLNRIQNVERKKAWYRKDRALNPDKGKNNALMHKYGITLEQKRQMWIAQDKKCVICTRELSTLFKAKVDHNHTTKKVRQLLCTRCNSHLGYIKEDFNVAINLAKYIQEHNGVI